MKVNTLLSRFICEIFSMLMNDVLHNIYTPEKQEVTDECLMKTLRWALKKKKGTI